MSKEHRFQATIVDAGTRVILVLPFNPNDLWGAKPRHHVSGTIADHRWRGPVDHDGTRFFVSLGPAWRRDCDVPLGRDVDVVLAPEGPQLDNVGADVAAALAAEPEAAAFFEGLPTFYRRNYVRWIEQAKRPATRAARIAQMVALLREGRRER